MDIYFQAHLTKLLKYTPQVLLLKTLRIHAISIIFRIIYQLKSQKILFQRDSTNNGNKMVQRNKLDAPLQKKKINSKIKHHQCGMILKALVHISTSLQPRVLIHTSQLCMVHAFTSRQGALPETLWLRPKTVYYEWQYLLYIRLSAFTES